MSLLRKALIALTACCAVTVGLGHSSQADVPIGARVEAEVAQWQVFAYEQATELAHVEQAVYDLQQQVGAYIADVIVQEQAWAAQQAAQQAEAERQAQLATRSAPAASQPAAMSSSNGGAHSDAWWHGVATCEQGGRNDPYFGYFSYMDGSAGGLSWDQQVAKGNATLATTPERLSQGGAWADACVNAGYAASPSG